MLTETARGRLSGRISRYVESDRSGSLSPQNITQWKARHDFIFFAVRSAYTILEAHGREADQLCFKVTCYSIYAFVEMEGAKVVLIRPGRRETGPYEVSTAGRLLQIHAL